MVKLGRRPCVANVGVETKDGMAYGWKKVSTIHTELNRFHIYQKDIFFAKEETRLGASPPKFPRRRESILAARSSPLIVRRGENDPRRSPGEIFDGEIWGGRPQSRFFQRASA